MLNARAGRGCSHCEPGVAMSWFKTGTHMVALCMNCLMEWFPGRSVEWLEERLDYYADHVGYKLMKANPRDGEEGLSLRGVARYPVRDEESGRWSERAKP